MRERLFGAVEYIQLASLDVDLDAVGPTVEDCVKGRRGHRTRSLAADSGQIVLAPGRELHDARFVRQRHRVHFDDRALHRGILQPRGYRRIRLERYDAAVGPHYGCGHQGPQPNVRSAVDERLARVKQPAQRLKLLLLLPPDPDHRLVWNAHVERYLQPTGQYPRPLSA